MRPWSRASLLSGVSRDSDGERTSVVWEEASSCLPVAAEISNLRSEIVL
jgi:hypothetical protein